MLAILLSQLLPPLPLFQYIQSQYITRYTQTTSGSNFHILITHPTVLLRRDEFTD